MKKFLLILFCLLVAVSISAYTPQILKKDGNFFLISVGDQNAYTTGDFLNKDFFIATDKITYGSSAGKVKVKIFLAKGITANSKIGITTKGKNIKITDVNINGVNQSILTPSSSSSYIYPTAFSLRSGLTSAILSLEFDPKQIGFLEKFDVILYDALNNPVAKLDPFLSNFNYSADGSILSATATNNYVLRLDLNSSAGSKVKDFNSEFWTNINITDANDLRFTDSTATTIYNYKIVSYTKGGRIVLDVNFGNIGNGNISFKMFWGNLTAPKIADTNTNYDIADSFEDGLYTGAGRVPDWNSTGGTGAIAINTTKPHIGAYSAEFTNNKWIRASIKPQDHKYSIWVNTNKVDSSAAVTGTAIYIEKADNGIITDMAIRQSKFVLDDGTQIGTVTPAINTWYKMEIAYIDNNNVADFYVYDINNNLIASLLNTATIGGTSGVIGKVMLYHEQTAVTYYDDIKHLIQTQFDYNFGNYATSNANPDFNFTSFYSYGTYKGGTIKRIDFNIMDPDNNSLLIDLNYSATATQGTGFSIFNDKNTFTLTCDSNNLVNSTNCFYNWTMPAIDGNFYLLGTASDGSAEDFNKTNFNFLIDSNAPTLYNQQPAVTYDKNYMPFDFNVAITDGNGSGVLRCIERVYINAVAYADTNIDVNAGSCYSSILGLPIVCGDKINVGWYGADNLDNLSAELATADINYSCLIPPTPSGPTAVNAGDRPRYFNKLQLQDLTKTALKTWKFEDTILLIGGIIIVLLLIIGVSLWTKK